MMGFFNDAQEQLRKQRLEEMENKRLRFAEQMHKEGFAPDYMLLLSSGSGGVYGLSRVDGKFCIVIGPGFGTEDDFVLECYDTPLPSRREEHYVPGEGMGGLLGFGKRSEKGFYLTLTRPDGSEISIPVITYKNSMLYCPIYQNPLLMPKRRRSNANVVWDMRPIENSMLDQIDKYLKEILGE